MRPAGGSRPGLALPVLGLLLLVGLAAVSRAGTPPALLWQLPTPSLASLSSLLGLTPPAPAPAPIVAPPGARSQPALQAPSEPGTVPQQTAPAGTGCDVTVARTRYGVPVPLLRKCASGEQDDD
jgi:hypothetical protein